MTKKRKNKVKKREINRSIQQNLEKMLKIMSMDY